MTGGDERSDPHNTAGSLIRAVREFHGFSQDALAAILMTCRRTVIRWEKRGTTFATWNHWNARANRWAELLARYQLAETLRAHPEGFNDRNQVRAAEIVREIGPRVVTRVEWEPKKIRRAAARLATQGKGHRVSGRNRSRHP